ncbi:MAG: macro domain-containing protein [Clostridia bacterium]|nr:macro domain-containing protein [Clostridia bacterium]
MPLLFIRNDITKMHTDAIVCPANEELIEGAGTSRAIFQAAGEEALAKACAAQAPCKMGTAKLTGAFKLPAKYIIHAVCPRWFDGKSNERKLLYSTYDKALELAKQYGIKSIAFPLLSAGNYDYPKAEALKTACHAITRFLMDNDMDVYLVFYTDEAVELGEKLFPMQKHEIDSDYVASKDESYIGTGKRAWIFGNKDDAKARQMLIDPSEDAVAQKELIFTGDDLDGLMSMLKPSFGQTLLKFVNGSGKKKVKIYENIISKKQFYDLLKDSGATPKKTTVLSLAVRLELTVGQTRELLKSAGYALSQSIGSDLIIQKYIFMRRYNPRIINMELRAAGFEKDIIMGEED